MGLLLALDVGKHEHRHRVLPGRLARRDRAPDDGSRADFRRALALPPGRHRGEGPQGRGDRRRHRLLRRPVAGLPDPDRLPRRLRHRPALRGAGREDGDEDPLRPPLGGRCRPDRECRGGRRGARRAVHRRRLRHRDDVRRRDGGGGLPRGRHLPGTRHQRRRPLLSRGAALARRPPPPREGGGEEHRTEHPVGPLLGRAPRRRKGSSPAFAPSSASRR